MRAHPYADRFPMLPQSELEELAESIRENGLRQPVVVTQDGLILDGRNRAAACELIGIEPETVVYEGDDLAEYVIDCNTTRRHMTAGARAMASAVITVDAYPERRSGGKWVQGATGFDENQNSSTFRTLFSRAGVILDWTPEVAYAVVSGELPIDVAYAEANSKRNAVAAEKQAKAIEANRKREATIREKEENDRKLAALTGEQSKFLANIEDGSMTISVAYAAHQEATRKEREERREQERAWRDSCRAIAESVRFLDGGETRARIFLENAYQHEAEFLPHQMRLTRTRIDAGIEFLEALKKGVHND